MVSQRVGLLAGLGANGLMCYSKEEGGPRGLRGI
jgi:hypothetical protein